MGRGGGGTAYSLFTRDGADAEQSQHTRAKQPKWGAGSGSSPIAGIVAKSTGTAMDALRETFTNGRRGIDEEERADSLLVRKKKRKRRKTKANGKEQVKKSTEKEELKPDSALLLAQ